MVATLTVGALEGASITAKSFGVNTTFTFQSIGSITTVNNLLQSKVLRYPGGTETETNFDITHPTDGKPDANGKPTQVAADVFLDYCAANNIAADIVVPTMPGLNTAAYGSRNLTAQFLSDLKTYIDWVLVKSNGNVTTFELGNEYAAYMTAAEYGRVASAEAVVIQQEINAYRTDHGLSASWDPKIAVQIYNQTGATNNNQQAARNATVIQNFTAAGLAAIDATVVHYYWGAGVDTINELSDYETMIPSATSHGFALIDSLMAAWDVATGRALGRELSEWNVTFKDIVNSQGQTVPMPFTGMAQVAPFLEIFSDATKIGISAMSVWAMQYNSVALGTPNGNGGSNGIATIGQFFNQAMMAKLMPVNGEQALREVATTDALAKVDMQAFANDSRAVVYAASKTLAAQDVAIDLGGGDNQVTITRWYVNAGSETNKIALLNHGAAIVNANGTLHFGGYDVLTYDINLKIDGTASADTRNGSIFGDQISGLGASDTLFGNGGADTLTGGDGSDRLTGGAGGDLMTGGTGVDTFVFAATTDSTTGALDQITDFVHGTDIIDLSAIDANSLAANNQAFTFLGHNAFTGVAGELRFDTTSRYLLGDVNGDKVADLTIWISNITQFWGANLPHDIIL